MSPGLAFPSVSAPAAPPSSASQPVEHPRHTNPPSRALPVTKFNLLHMRPRFTYIITSCKQPKKRPAKKTGERWFIKITYENDQWSAFNLNYKHYFLVNFLVDHETQRAFWGGVSFLIFLGTYTYRYLTPTLIYIFIIIIVFANYYSTPFLSVGIPPK